MGPAGALVDVVDGADWVNREKSGVSRRPNAALPPARYFQSTLAT